MKARTCLSLFVSCGLLTVAAWSDPLLVSSPNGRIQISFELREGVTTYAVTFDGKSVVEPSALGFQIQKNEGLDLPFVEKTTVDLTKGFTVMTSSLETIDESWRPVWGEVSAIRNHGSQLTVRLDRDADYAMNVVLRAYDDGVAFRYVIPEQEKLERFEILSEESEFRLSGNHMAWWIPNNYDSYEDHWRTTRLSEINAVNTPVTMRSDDGIYLSIHEAALTDYAGMTLEKTGENAFESVLVKWPDGVKVKTKTPMKTPWRTIQIAESAGDLIESHLIVNLNEPCVIEDTSWIKPMKYMGIWWSLHLGKETWTAGPKHGATTENAKHYIDFCAKHGIGGLLIEGWNLGWETWFGGGHFSFTEAYPDFNLEEVARYAGEKGVYLIGHHETGGNIPTYEAQLDDAFELYSRLGVHAVKTGYAGGIQPKGFHHHGQWMVQHYRRVVQKAAEHQIMIDAHEPIKPTGIRRTYPNMMTREGVRGMEYNAWSDGNPPEHTTILPFTRGLAGPMDYTPGIFDLMMDKYKPDNRVYSTLANQLALYVVLYSPLQMAADLPENYEGHPAFEFIKAVPVTWDETRVLNGEPGDFVTIARRSGQSWYVGSITDENARELIVPLDFLSPDVDYTAKIYADGEDGDWDKNPTSYAITEKKMKNGDQLTLKLAAGGGQAIQILPD